MSRIRSSTALEDPTGRSDTRAFARTVARMVALARMITVRMFEQERFRY